MTAAPGRRLDPLAAFVLTIALCWMVQWWRGPAGIEGSIGDGSGFARTRAWLVSRGFSPPEIDAATGQQFSWSGARATLIVPRLNRAHPYALLLSAQAGRPGPAPEFPTVTVRVDGEPAAAAVVGNEPATLTVTVPPSRSASVRVDLDVSPTFVPGAGDRRQLGILVKNVSLTPVSGGLPVPWRSLIGAAIGAGIAAGVLALFATFLWTRAVGVALVSAAATTFMWYDAALLGTAPDRLVWTSSTVLLLAGASRWLLGRRPGWRDDRWLHTAVAIAWVLAIVKWWCFVHPQINLGDSLFHVHRAEWVWDGRFFFTSTTPRPYFEFPYAIGLYVASWPASDLVTAPADRVLLLRSITLLVDAATVFALIPLVRRLGWSTWGMVAVAIAYGCCRMGTQVLCAANLTNLFAQALFSAAIAALALAAASRRIALPVAAGGALLTAGFLSHFSTLLVGVPTALALAAGLWWRGSVEQRRASLIVAGALTVSVAVAYGLYYSHFHDVYARTFDRVMAREGEAASGSIAAPPAVKVVRQSAETLRNFGWPLLAVASVGLLVGLRRRPDPVIARAIGTWTLVWLGLSVVGVLTAVELRANLSLQPVVAVLGAAGVAWMAERRGAAALVAGIATLAIALDGIREWIRCVVGVP